MRLSSVDEMDFERDVSRQTAWLPEHNAAYSTYARPSCGSSIHSRIAGSIGVCGQYERYGFMEEEA